MHRLTYFIALTVLATWTPTFAAGTYQGNNLRGMSRYSNGAANAIYGRPTVSPYLNLLRPQGGVSIPNYQSLVRPQLDQERVNQQQGRQLQQLQRRIYQGPTSQSSGGAPLPIRETGHTTGFMNYSAYFPQLQTQPDPAAAPRRATPGGGR